MTKSKLAENPRLGALKEEQRQLQGNIKYLQEKVGRVYNELGQLKRANKNYRFRIREEIQWCGIDDGLSNCTANRYAAFLFMKKFAKLHEREIRVRKNLLKEVEREITALTSKEK